MSSLKYPSKIKRFKIIAFPKIPRKNVMVVPPNGRLTIEVDAVVFFVVNKSDECIYIG